MLSKCGQIVNVNSTVPAIEDCSDYFRAFWKVETHKDDMQTISASYNFPGHGRQFCSRQVPSVHALRLTTVAVKIGFSLVMSISLLLIRPLIKTFGQGL